MKLRLAYIENKQQINLCYSLIFTALESEGVEGDLSEK
jgi:hypothetical protein